MKVKGAVIGVLIAVFALLLVGTTSVSANEQYFGFTEVDKGEGVWALINNYNQSWHVDVDSSAGLIAEFYRRHRNLRVLCVTPLVLGQPVTVLGFLILTEPRIQK